ncbi:MAG: hypothetical protein QOF48_3732 [Verrucomicrobiota bacterium]|jgi:hypothetical protein
MRYTPSTQSTPSTAVMDPPDRRPQDECPPQGLKKVNFGGITKKKEDTKTAHPVVPDPNGELAIIAARIRQRVDEFDALEASLETDKKELRCLVTPFYFTNSHGKADVASSVSVKSAGGEVLVTFQNRYKQLPDERPLVPLLGEHVASYFKQSFELKIDGDKLPIDGADELLAKLQALFAEYNATDALSVKECVKPQSDFHAKRHLLLTAEQNMAIDEACPIVAMIKTKGRK